MTRDEVNTKKDFIIFILLELNKKTRPVDFGQFFMEIAPTIGIEPFKELLNEMVEKGWLTKIEQPDGFLDTWPFLPKLDLRYGISIDGIEYLISLGLIEEKFKNKENVTKHTVINGGQVIINEQSNNGNQSLSDNAFESPITQTINNNTDNNPKKSWIELISWVTGIVIAIIGIYEFVVKQFFV